MADEPQKESDRGVQPPSLTIDWDLYGKYLEDSDLTDDEKRDCIQTLWGIVVACVDLGFGLHPVQQACGHNDQNRIFLPHDLLSSLNDSNTNMNDKTAAHGNHDPAGQEES